MAEKVIFPQVDVKVAYVGIHGMEGFELHIMLSTLVRISDDEGNFFYAPALREEIFGVRDQTDNIDRFLSLTVSTFMTSVYKMILAEVPDALVTTAKGERIYKPDTSSLTEQERMGVKPKPLMSHKGIWMDMGEPVSNLSPAEKIKMMHKTGIAMIDHGGSVSKVELLTFEEIAERYPLTPEEAFELGRPQIEGK